MNTIDHIKDLLKGLKKYTDGKILGFPGSNPLPVAIEAFSLIMKDNPNAIMLHFKGSKTKETSEGKESEAFAPIHEMEVQLLMWITSLLYHKTKKTLEEVVKEWQYCNVWGYMTSGGTESNIFALWVARNYFKKKYPSEDIQIIAPWCDVTHYSIFKALNLLGLTSTNESYYEVSENLHYVPIGKNGYPDYSCLNNKLKNLPTIVILNAPSINTGLIDDTNFINNLTDTIDNDKIWIHNDGAYGMFFIPFLEETDYENIGKPIIDFYKNEKKKLEKLYFPTVTSISLDLHKMGLIPYPAGVILINKEKGWRYIQRSAGYIAGHYDNTLSGSRSGAAVGSAYAAIKELGYHGYKEIVYNCLKLTNKFLNYFQRFPDIFSIVGNPITNVFAVKFSPNILKELKSNNNVIRNIVEKSWVKDCVKDFTIVDTPLRVGFIQEKKVNVEKNSSQEEEFDSKIWRFVIMPHVTDEVFDNFSMKLNNFILFLLTQQKSINLGP